MIKGNHDKQKNDWWRSDGFDEVTSYPIIYKEWFDIQHELPTYYNDSTPYFYIYDNVHGSEMYRKITKQTACVAVEQWGNTPVNLEMIIELAKLV